MSFIKNFLDWFTLKPKLDQKNIRPLFNEREIWWCSIGINIGCETDGKNQLHESARKTSFDSQKIQQKSIFSFTIDNHNKHPS